MESQTLIYMYVHHDVYFYDFQYNNKTQKEI